jgi:hypothetical protein
MNIPFISGNRTQPQPNQQTQMRPIMQAQDTQQPQSATGPRAGYPQMQPTRDERYLDFLLNPCIPRNRPHLEKFWPLATEASKHLQLTKITDPGTLFRLKRAITDLYRVADWDAPEYFEQRCLKFFSDIQMLKSVTYSTGMREREALVACTVSNIVRDDRTPPPKESSSFLGGMFSR